MKPTLPTRFLLLAALVIAAVGGIDAGLDEAWDHLVLFLLAIVVMAVLLMRVNGTRPPVPIRADLVRWLRNRASVTGESFEQIADRALANYRSLQHSQEDLELPRSQ